MRKNVRNVPATGETDSELLLSVAGELRCSNWPVQRNEFEITSPAFDNCRSEALISQICVIGNDHLQTRVSFRQACMKYLVDNC